MLGLGGLALLHRRYQVLQTAIVDLDDDRRPIRAVALLLALQLGLRPLVDRIGHLDRAETLIFLTAVLDEIPKLTDCLVVEAIANVIQSILIVLLVAPGGAGRVAVVLLLLGDAPLGATIPLERGLLVSVLARRHLVGLHPRRLGLHRRLLLEAAAAVFMRA